MAKNNFRIVFKHHILKHGAKDFPYFDYYKKKFVLDRIKALSNTKRKDNTIFLKIFF